MKFLRNKLALLVLAALAVGGVAFLVLAAGANVNCTGGQCYSTNGRTTASGGGTNNANATTGVFTGENDTGSIECREAPSGDTTFDSGGGNDVLYLVNPTTGLTSITVNGEDGDDVIVDGCFESGSGSGLTNFLNGGNGNDVIIQNGADPDSPVDDAGRLYGGNGNDLLAGGQGNDFVGDVNGSGSCTGTESDPNNDVFVGGPGTDTYCTADNDGDDIVIIHAGDVPAGSNNEQYTCRNNDTILLFGFELDLVVELKSTDAARFYNLTSAPTGLTTGQVAIGDLQNNPNKDPAGARYTFEAASGSTCTIIVVE